ncbi:hypothetical protein [Variovorax sp. JS1663]|uniref:hypothetical protein n=1 Tax=Variovorax sp. JS1663 TaxID=1851577 RepID=UPI000B344265|nr:hypothetical protein [Variovorax sp. JS1663]OUM03691.1 hypothetical protein A8M77_04010 [Variovorax sp. JS1663]
MAFRTLCHLVFLLIVLSLTWLDAAADPRPSYRPFEVKSGNRQFTARVFVADKQGGERAWQWRYRLQVVSTQDDAVQWEHDYVYDGHPGGDLSDDGRYFADTSIGYRDVGQLVSIYRAQGQHHFSAADLHVRPTGLEGTRSRLPWLHDVHFVNDESGAARFVVETLEGSRCIRLRPEILVEDACTGE